MTKLATFILLLFTTLSQAAESTTIWLEAEDTTNTNFEPGPFAQVTLDGPSGYAYLRLYTPKGHATENKLPFFAEIPFTVTTEATYQMWLAGSPQNVGWAAPCRFRLDQQPFIDLKGKPWTSGPYGGTQHLLGWFPAASLTLKPGPHTLRFEVSSPRAQYNLFTFFLDTIVLTTDDTFKPAGNHPKYSPHPLRTTDFTPEERQAITDRIEIPKYRRALANSNEQVGPETTAEVVRKIKARPLPQAPQKLPHEFGLHGMERPFVLVDSNAEKSKQTFELLARAGVDGYRTAEGCWSRLGLKFDNFKELDFQLEQAQKYGAKDLLTIGYPASPYTVAGFYLSAAKSEYEPLYREYLRILFTRIKGKGVEYVELGNEVDATETWWRKSTAEMYVNELRMVKEELTKIDPTIKIVALGATRARSPKGLTDTDGRAFVRKCFDLGMDKYADAYSLHYVADLRERDFVDFMRSEIARAGSAKPILDTEENRAANPCDIVRTFARCFFLYDLPRVDYYMARDWYESGRSLVKTSLFDYEWNPKLRLLAYAASVDAMKGRVLVGIAEPTDGIEAYVLKFANDYKPPLGTSPYSIVMWNHARDLLKLDPKIPIAALTVTGLRSATSALNWRLDPLAFDADNGQIPVAEQPVIVFTNDLPDWKLMTTKQYLDHIAAISPPTTAP